MILLEGEEIGAYANISYSRVCVMILLEGEEKGAYATIVTVGCR